MHSLSKMKPEFWTSLWLSQSLFGIMLVYLTRLFFCSKVCISLSPYLLLLLLSLPCLPPHPSPVCFFLRWLFLHLFLPCPNQLCNTLVLSVRQFLHTFTSVFLYISILDTIHDTHYWIPILSNWYETLCLFFFKKSFSVPYLLERHIFLLW